MTKYEPRPGSFSLFKNDRKEKDAHPDYRGDGMDLDGNACWISAWLKDGAKGKFLSISVKLKEGAGKSGDDFLGDTRGGGGSSLARSDSGRSRGSEIDLDDDIPFITF